MVPWPERFGCGFFYPPASLKGEVASGQKTIKQLNIQQFNRNIYFCATLKQYKHGKTDRQILEIRLRGDHL